MIDRSFLSESLAAFGKVSPPAVVVTASVSGFTLQDWTYVATIGYVVLQGAYLAWKWVRDWRAGRVAA